MVVCGFIPLHSPTFPWAWNVTIELHFWPAPLQTFPLVVSPRLRSQQKMWALLVNNQIMSHKLHEWLKFTEFFMVMVLGSVEDEKCFSTLSFIKNKLRNRLVKHLDLILHMYAQIFYFLEIFSFSTIMKSWTQKKVQRVA